MTQGEGEKPHITHDFRSVSPLRKGSEIKPLVQPPVTSALRRDQVDYARKKAAEESANPNPEEVVKPDPDEFKPRSQIRSEQGVEFKKGHEDSTA